MTAARAPHDEDQAPPLPEGVLPTDRRRPDGVVVHSLTAHAICEMERHRWIESEKAGVNRGRDADLQWLRTYWSGWARSKLLEHLYGWRCWSAFGAGTFGLLRRGTVEKLVPHHVLRKVASILGNGGENLDVIAWAVENDQDLDSLFWLLDRIDINAVRHRFLTDHIRLFLPE